MPDYLKKLNKQQYDAATTIDGPLLILAGAGSGKTGTMTHRIAYMVQECGVSPYSILAVTFTNKAAKEMRERVEALVGSVQGMWIQTFHSACLRMLRIDGERLGYGSNFVVYDPSDQKSLMKSLCKERNLDEKRYAPAYVLSEISKAKEAGMNPAEFARKKGGLEIYQVIYQLYDAYETQLKKNNAMDFDDLILNAVRLLESDEEILLKYQTRFKYIMVDEYQDTNMLQYRLIKLLAKGHRNICVVGDDDQSIYQWRGADIRNIMEFEKDFPGAKVIKLEQNYRSTANIINAAHSVICRNKQRKDKKLWTEAPDGEKIEYYRAESDYDEARFIADKINALIRKEPDLNYSDFAVLYRTNVQSRVIEDVFGKKSMPYQVLSGLRFYDRKEIKDMLCYMRLVDNPKDDVSLLRIINEPKRGVGAKTVAGIQAAASAMGKSMLEAMADPDILAGCSSKASAALSDLAHLIGSLSIEKDNMSVSDIYDTLLVRSGYIKALEDTPSVENDSRLENLMEFKSVIEEKSADAEASGEPLTLSSFMEGMALISDVDNHDPDQEAVVLMTMHSAKGLEFPVVFMPGMEEERRLCYVGMTRAKERLFMSSAEVRMLYGKTESRAESVFLREIDRKYMTGNAVYTSRNPGMSTSRYNPVSTYSRGSYTSPIAQIEASKKAAAPKQTLVGKAVEPGDAVEHPKFGDGTVIEIKGNVISVMFEDFGVKKMALDMAPLKKK